MSRSNRGPSVVVTGGAGAIGSHLVQSLISRGETVDVIDNLSSGRRAALPKDARVTLHKADLRRLEAFQGRVRGAKAIWHLASNPDIRRGTEDPSLDLRAGTIATFNALEAARRHDVPEFHFSSSSVVYGFPRDLPTPEDYGPLMPESMYGAAKLAAEGLVSAYAHSYGIRGSIFRFANIIGPGVTHGVLFDFFEKLRRTPRRLEVLGDGFQTKSYLRTEDCVSAMLTIADKGREKVNTYNIGSLDRLSVREIAEKVVRVHTPPIEIVYTGGDRGWTGDIPQQWLKVDKLLELGWRPRHSSAEAIDLTIEDLLAERRR